MHVINCYANKCCMNFEECEVDSDCCSKNCLMVSLPPFCYKYNGQNDESLQYCKREVRISVSSDMLDF